METTKLDYREFIKRELFRRCQNNSEYSLRAFARDLGMASSQLSRVLAKKRNLSLEKAGIVAPVVAATKLERQAFLALVEMETSKTQQGKEQALKKLMQSCGAGEKHVLPLTDFALISDWFHLAVLELFIIDPKTNLKKIAQKLGITQLQSKFSVDLLLQLGLLQDDNGKIIVTHKKMAIGKDVPSLTIRKYHQQNIEKALVAIHEQSVEQRYLSSKTFSVDKEDLPRLRQTIEEFKTKVSMILKGNPKKNSVYQLNIQLFQLDDKGEK